MGNKLVTEADRKRTPAPVCVEGYKVRQERTGQKISLERGKATRNTPTAGKRPPNGG